jgi:hypothetical protein
VRPGGAVVERSGSDVRRVLGLAGGLAVEHAEVAVPAFLIVNYMRKRITCTLY